MEKAATIAITIVNAIGNSPAEHLHDIPRRAEQIAGHGVRIGAAMALAEVQQRLDIDATTITPIRRSTQDQHSFDDLVEELEDLAEALIAGADLIAVVELVYKG